jgi:hypothetical protein
LTAVQLASCICFLWTVIKFKPGSVYSICEWTILQAAGFVLAANGQLFLEGLRLIDTRLWIVAATALVNIVLAFFFLRNYEEVVLNSFNTRVRVFIAVTALSIYLYLAGYFGQNLVFWLYESFLLLGMQIHYSYWAGGKGGISL